MSTKRSNISLTDLPSNVLVEILAKLPLRMLFVARSVCKTFNLLTTPNPHFINPQSSNAAQILVFQFGQVGWFKVPSYLLRLADQEFDYNSELKPFFRLPKMAPLSPHFSQEVCSFFLVNSCNGLVYLLPTGLVQDQRSLLCNPVTNEYIVISEVDPKLRLSTTTMSTWLGFSRITDQYKVLRIFHRYNNNTHLGEVLAQVSVIGSDTWRYIDDTPLRVRHLFRDVPEALVNGVMYWHHSGWSDLFSFDFEVEKFREMVLPVKFQEEHRTSIGVLGDCLCLSCNVSDGHHVDLWVMRKCGWRKEFVVDLGRPVRSLFRPLQFLRNGEILMLLVGYGLVCYDPRSETLRWFGLNRRLKLDYRVVALTPSFVPLKDTLKVEKVFSELRPRGDEKEEL